MFKNVDLATLHTYAEECIKKHRKLEAEIENLSFEELLAKLTDEKRLKNGLSIPDSEVKLIKEGEGTWHFRVNYPALSDGACSVRNKSN
ncbi:MAG: hypothetical protein ACW963_01985 [Candidatus Sifarchaeia archaeon]